MSSSDEGETGGLVLAVDIGGTFTDVTLRDLASGAAWRAKTPSQPADPSRAFLDGVRLVLAQSGRPAADIVRVLHGTTVATNMILEGKAARTALVTTEGFRHVLEIGRQDIPRAANLHAWVKPRRPVPPGRVLEVAERIGPDGAVLRALDEASVAAAAEACRALRVEAVAVCLLHAFANPAHERRVAALLRAALPEVAVSAACDVLPVVREYERSLAAVLNASVMPGIGRYVARLEARLRDAGCTARLLLMQSNGGVAGAATIRRAPALTALSGPAAGVVGARDVAAACGIADIITVDIGGTSADISLLRGGRVALTEKGRVGDWPLPLPMVDMVTIGAGGGSLAAVVDGALVVGPESAGADPGPACYGSGGTRPTVTDAHLVLGQLPAGLLDGRLALDRDAAARAIVEAVARPTGLSLHAAARGILAIAEHAMVGAIRVLSVERGHDPRDFTLVPFGGAGPLHGCALAELLGMTRVLVPPAPGLLCAEGLLGAELRAAFSRTPRAAGSLDDAAARETYGALEAEAAAWLEEERVPAPDRSLARVAMLRYQGQGGELAVPWAGSLAATEAGFAEAHAALYGFGLEARVELVTLRLDATGRLATGPRQPEAAAASGQERETTVHFAGGSRRVPLLTRESLAPGTTRDGPLLATQLDSTVLVPPGWRATVHASGALLLERVEELPA